jgi:hypothetical protein
MIFRGQAKVSDVATSSDQTVFGVIQTQSENAALVTLRDGGHALTLMSARWERTLVESNTPIIHATVAPTRPLIAYTTGLTNVAVFDVDRGGALCSF